MTYLGREVASLQHVTDKFAIRQSGTLYQISDTLFYRCLDKNFLSNFCLIITYTEDT